MLTYVLFLFIIINTCDCQLHKREDVSVMKNWRESLFWNQPFKPPSYFVLTTWNFGNATQIAYNFLTENDGSAINAVVEGCSYCERAQCDFTVGYGGSPDEKGETTLDAMVFDGVTMNVGAVGGLRRIKNAIGVARAVLHHSDHSILVGDAATQFAKLLGFKEETLSTNKSIDQWAKWKNNNCQPNFWEAVVPNPKASCGPYHPIKSYKTKFFQTKMASHEKIVKLKKVKPKINTKTEFHHDTIGQIVMDSTGAIVAGTSSNGALHKIPGRMGDAAVPGAGGYADARYGAAVATGDGDIMMRFSPAAAVVELLKNNMSPEKATRQVIYLIREKYPNFNGAVLAMNRAGNFSASCNGFDLFPFTVASSNIDGGKVKKYYVQCFSGSV